MKMESALGLVSGLSEVMVHEEDVDFLLPLDVLGHSLHEWPSSLK